MFFLLFFFDFLRGVGRIRWVQHKKTYQTYSSTWTEPNDTSLLGVMSTAHVRRPCALFGRAQAAATQPFAARFRVVRRLSRAVQSPARASALASSELRAPATPPTWVNRNKRGSPPHGNGGGLAQTKGTVQASVHDRQSRRVQKKNQLHPAPTTESFVRR